MKIKGLLLSDTTHEGFSKETLEKMHNKTIPFYSEIPGFQNDPEKPIGQARLTYKDGKVYMEAIIDDTCVQHGVNIGDPLNSMMILDPKENISSIEAAAFCVGPELDEYCITEIIKNDGERETKNE